MHSTCAPAPKFLRRLRISTCTFIGFLVATLLVLSTFLAPRAAAHDVLVSSDPEDGAEVTDIKSLTLTFNNDPLDVNPVISISGPDGQEKALDVTPVVDGRDVYVEFSDLEPGEYAVSWCVVSSDGHPIEGNQSFTVLSDPDAEEPTEEEPAPDPDAPVSSEDDASDAAQSEDQDDSAAIDTNESDSHAADNDEESAPEPTSENADDESDDSGGTPVMIWIALALAVAVALGLFGKNTSKKKAQDTNDETPSKTDNTP